MNLVELFYKRQFATETAKISYTFTTFQQLLKEYYNAGFADMPTVHYFAEQMRLSPNYLGDVIKAHTHKSAIQHIHDFITERAQELITGTHLTNTEITFQSGFRFPNYFSKLFKKHTHMSPKEFRKMQKRSKSPHL